MLAPPPGIHLAPAPAPAPPLGPPAQRLPIFDNPGLYEKLDAETLFFIFYNQPGSHAQFLAARELKRQAWRYHKQHGAWFQVSCCPGRAGGQRQDAGCGLRKRLRRQLGHAWQPAGLLEHLHSVGRHLTWRPADAPSPARPCRPTPPRSGTRSPRRAGSRATTGSRARTSTLTTCCTTSQAPARVGGRAGGRLTCSGQALALGSRPLGSRVTPACSLAGHLSGGCRTALLAVTGPQPVTFLSSLRVQAACC